MQNEPHQEPLLKVVNDPSSVPEQNIPKHGTSGQSDLDYGTDAYGTKVPFERGDIIGLCTGSADPQNVHNQRIVVSVQRSTDNRAKWWNVTCLNLVNGGQNGASVGSYQFIRHATIEELQRFQMSDVVLLRASWGAVMQQGALDCTGCDLHHAVGYAKSVLERGDRQNALVILEQVVQRLRDQQAT